MDIAHCAVDEENNLTPREIVARLDEYIVGQEPAKRAVAVAIRNRWRRRRLEPAMRKEVMPKNILMIGPTGVGKTEIARRLAELTKAPFLKVEASRYTEVGYHGRDVESMIRDLAKIAVAQVRQEAINRVSEEARMAAEERIIDLLLPHYKAEKSEEDDAKGEIRRGRTREKLRRLLRAGEFDERTVEISAPVVMPVAGIFGTVGGGEDLGLEIQDMMQRMLPQRHKTRRMRVPEALRLLEAEEADKLIDEEAIGRLGLERAEQNGIIFIDEIDKIIGSQRTDGPDVSREGVQRDLLPIVEGTTVATKWGTLRTDYILFIAAGAFHGKKPADLIPELQGRFPVRVELSPLSREDYKRILTHPRNALTKQYQLLLAAEQVNLVFEESGLAAIAEFAAAANATMQDIGARRLHTIMEKILENISFDAPERRGQTVNITAAEVRDSLAGILKDEDLSRFVL